MIHDDNFFNFLEKHHTDEIDKEKIKKFDTNVRSKKLVANIINAEARLKRNRSKKVETTCKTLCFESASKASFALGYFASSPIKDAIKYKTKCAGYYWRYIEDDKE